MIYKFHFYALFIFVRDTIGFSKSSFIHPLDAKNLKKDRVSPVFSQFQASYLQ